MMGKLEIEEKAAIDDRRLRVLEITPQFILVVLLHSQVDAQASTFWFDGVPLDSEIVRAGYDYERDLFFLVIKSESFALVDEGNHIPKMTATGHTELIKQKVEENDGTGN